MEAFKVGVLLLLANFLSTLLAAKDVVVKVEDSIDVTTDLLKIDLFEERDYESKVSLWSK